MSHKAIVARVDKVEEIPGANTIQIAYVLGERVVVSKDVGVGYVGLLFPCELQLSEEYCSYNNLYRHSEYNRDKDKKGFFDDNRKVRSQKFMGVQSDAYFASLESLDGLAPYEGSRLSIGDQLDSINGNEICRKFVSKQTQEAKQKQKKVSDKPKTPLFHEHVETEQFKHFADRIPIGARISIHHKMHGTSARYTNTLVRKHPTGWRGQINRLVLALSQGRYRVFPDIEGYELVAGTRRVVLYQTQRDKIGYNGSEKFRFDWLNKLSPYLEPGVTVYAEIVGYANDKPIMQVHSTAPMKSKEFTKKYGETMTYKYGCPEGTNRLIVYRVTYTTAGGQEIDLSVDQLKHWCEVRGLESTTVLDSFVFDGDVSALRKHVEFLTENTAKGMTEDYQDPSHVNEGVVIRVDYKDTTPKFLKQKSFAFRVLEGIANETTVDTEDAA